MSRRGWDRADLDHTRDFAHGGATVVENLGVACRRHHRIKHAGWRLSQPQPGHFTWLSPLGHTHHVGPNAIDE
jgi:hypothetical protein